MSAPDAAVPADGPNSLTWLAIQLDSIASFQDRPGALAQVEDIAARLRTAASEMERLRAIEQQAAAVVESWRKLRPHRPEMAAMIVRPLDALASCYPSEIDEVFAAMADEAARRFEGESS